jgi:hypothetical protein
MTEATPTPPRKGRSYQQKTKRSFSLRLSESARSTLVALSKAMNISQTAVLEIAIRNLAKQEGTQTMSTNNEHIILNDENAVDWQGPGYYESFSIVGEQRNVWQRVSTISQGNNSYHAVLAQRPEDLRNKKPSP